MFHKYYLYQFIKFHLQFTLIYLWLPGTGIRVQTASRSVINIISISKLAWMLFDPTHRKLIFLWLWHNHLHWYMYQTHAASTCESRQHGTFMLKIMHVHADIHQNAACNLLGRLKGKFIPKYMYWATCRRSLLFCIPS